MCVGAVAISHGRLLLVQRGRAPAAGKWSLPGGRVEWGETLEAAVEREVAEETGLDVRCGELAGWVERIGETHHYVIADFWVSSMGHSAPRPGDDAAEARWVSAEQLEELDLTVGLGEFLERIGARGRLL